MLLLLFTEKSLSLVQLFGNPMDWNLPGSSLSVEFPRQEYCSGLLFLSPGDLSHPGIETPSALAGRFFTTEPPGKPKMDL